jgi:hypothetical protein
MIVVFAHGLSASARPAESGWGQGQPGRWGRRGPACVDLAGGPACMQLCSVRTFWTVPKLASDRIPMGLDVNMDSVSTRPRFY